MEVDKMARQRKIILANNSRFVRDMLKKVIAKSPGLEIVSEIEDLAELPARARQAQADWAIVLLSPDEEVPELVEKVIREQPTMRFLLMGVDGSHARMKWSEPREVPLDEKNLSELLDLLRQEQPQNESKERIKA
jgi:DNA-binding NarL/FixJ family response regulator